MQSMEGIVRGSFGMVQDNEKSIFSNVDADLYNLDIRQFFDAFNNFGQKQLTHEHLKGTISGTTVFSSRFDSTFSILPETILGESDIIIRDGELNNFAPIMDLSRFVDLEELQNIRFNTLENTIMIKDRQVIIPVMDIKSNAMDLTASGMHGFNNQYEYRLMLKLSQLLYGKARRSKNSEFVIAEDENDTRILFLKIYDVAKQEEKHVYKNVQIIFDKNEMKFAVNGGYINLLPIQLPGKRKMEIRDVLNGLKLTETALMA